ncbi:MAG: hypothetical protein ABI434_00480 [Burkholderiaceae bacterium]
MSTMLQTLANGEPTRCRPTDLRQYRGQRAAQGDASPTAIAPWAETSHTRFAQWHTACFTSSDKNQEFIDLLADYRDSGGLARTHELIGMFKRGGGGDTEQLAGWIVTGHVISIEWQNQTWFPWFQFDRDLGRPQLAVGQIYQELCSVMDDWEIARWFVLPNAWLDDSTPAQGLTTRPGDLLCAARAYRYLAKG